MMLHRATASVIAACTDQWAISLCCEGPRCCWWASGAPAGSVLAVAMAHLEQVQLLDLLLS
jgi:hypothetical protein